MAKEPISTAPADETPAVDISETPEFQMALAKATAEIHDAILADVRALMAESGAKAIPAEQSEIERLARAIASSNAEMADQGTNRKRVAPEILEARRKSEKKMHALLDKVHELPKSERPVYRVRSKVYLGDKLIEPYQRGQGGTVTPTHIVFLSAPNLGLEPVNAKAQEIYAAFMGSIGGGDNLVNGQIAPDALGAKPFWMTNNGAVITAATVTARSHGMVMEADPIMANGEAIADVGNGRSRLVAEEITSVDDPRATKIPVLGTIHPPAVRGSSSPRAL